MSLPGEPHEPPDPAPAATLDDLVERLRRLKIWAGNPSYGTIKDRVNAAWTTAGRPPSELTIRSTVAHCFQPGRRRLDTGLVVAIVEALHPDPGYVAQWRQALRVIGGEIQAESQVRVHDRLPPDLAGFIGRTGELDALRRASRFGGPGAICTIEGMAGVGKTQLAVHTGHLLHRQESFDRVLFVNLRGFHPDRTQPPANPAAVLDGFLRLLGMPGHQIPHDLGARIAAYRKRIDGIRVLVVLDNAATTEQVRPLVPSAPGCLTLVTSRRSLVDLPSTVRLTVGVFSPDEAVKSLTAAVPDVPVGADPAARQRIARRCGHLPLAVSLIAGHIRGTSGWTLTDHADRLDERHRERRLDTGIELALALSYQHLPAGRQRLLRLLALHPGPDFDAYAAAALADSGLEGAEADLAQLHGDHLLQRTWPGRYTFHDLVRDYAATRAHDEDPPSERRAALTRLFDHYLSTAAAAMNTLYPAEAVYRPQISPAGTPAPDEADPDAAIAWLDTERVTLVAVASHTAGTGWPGHTVDLARTLFRYLQGGYYTEALSVHNHAFQAARDSGDLLGQAHALLGTGVAHAILGRSGTALENLRQALARYRQTGYTIGQAHTRHQLGAVTERSGHYSDAAEHFRQALVLYRRAGDQAGEALAHVRVGTAMQGLGRLAEALEHCRQGLSICRQTGHRFGEAYALTALGTFETLSGDYGPAHDHLEQSLTMARQLGSRGGEAGVLDGLGLLNARLGRLEEAADYYRRSWTMYGEIGHQFGEAAALNGLGETACAAGQAADAVDHHLAAHAIATDIGAVGELARAHAGLGHAQRALGDTDQARDHYRRAAALFTEIGAPEADEILARLAEI
jgi:tetratricopeptide (TPR) repeat protein